METTTTSSTAVPYSVEYGIYTLSVERRRSDGKLEVLHRFQQKGLYNTLYGIPLGGKGHHPVHTAVEDAAKWINGGGLVDPLQSTLDVGIGTSDVPRKEPTPPAPAGLAPAQAPAAPTTPTGNLSTFDRGLQAYQAGSYAVAFSEWRALAEKGDAASQYDLGLLYIDGKGVPMDYALAVRWFERSAQQGYVKAQLNLGILSRDGKGVKRDYVQAYKWLSLCAANGDSKCQSRRDEIATKLSRSELIRAQRFATEWKPRNEFH